jgi:hypothetical protein
MGSECVAFRSAARAPTHRCVIRPQPPWQLRANVWRGVTSPGGGLRRLMAHDGSSHMLDLRLGIRRPRQVASCDANSLKSLSADCRIAVGAKIKPACIFKALPWQTIPRGEFDQQRVSPALANLISLSYRRLFLKDFIMTHARVFCSKTTTPLSCICRITGITLAANLSAFSWFAFKP